MPSAFAQNPRLAREVQFLHSAYDAASHKGRCTDIWSFPQAQAYVQRVVQTVSSGLGGEQPNYGSWHELAEATSLYSGAAGRAIALAYLNRDDEHAARSVQRALQAVRAYGYADERSYSYMAGALGVAAAGVRLAVEGAQELLCELAGRQSKTREIFFGEPGLLLALCNLQPMATTMSTNASSVCADLWSSWDGLGDGVHLWRQQIFGDSSYSLGAAHGFAGTANALLRYSIANSLDGQTACEHRITSTALATYTSFGDSLINWPDAYGVESSFPSRLQWCFGAAGIASSLSAVRSGADLRFDALLEAAGETVWSAGPSRKGSSLCHGTAGNGYLFLKLFKRTGAQTWLERARRFAAHAMTQECDIDDYSTSADESLWTGKLGVACFVHACLHGDHRIPTIDFL